MSFYEVWYYQERGFASESHKVASFRSKKKAKAYAKKMNEEDTSARYSVHEKEFMDCDCE